MRRRRNISLHPKYIFGILTAVCVAIMILSFLYGDKLSPVKTAFGSVLTPMQKGINTVGRTISDKMDNFQELKGLKSTNKKLENEVETLKFQNKALQQDKSELSELRKLFKLDSLYPDYPKVGARVIGKNTNNWYNTFTIDKGKDDGLKVDMNVIAGDGLVGIITEVGHNYSTVRSIIDDSSSVTGVFSKTKDDCMVDGDLTLVDDGYIRVGYIRNKQVQIKDGYEVVTSTKSTKFLPGLLIGYASNVKLDSNNLQQSGYLTPSVDFKHLDTVLVITKLKEKLK
ncbi:rod shape-determining protein MreC [Anaeromicropila herbilytica]|uniref:Cell shape-determining protein MreC n=1 Tax=Anaeromicropila herbilytica TaxID=2785025 RepID=A0A7R7ELH4_9FIRM|nr:rod shape-determining protein MreC [Anaeromicropila herbilytica]BCN31210.1 rod shape-determining protein MreC [Anaeromicropila herbilytica]